MDLKVNLTWSEQTCWLSLFCFSDSCIQAV